MEVLYQESNPKISKVKFEGTPRTFENWGEEFVISFDFYALDNTTGVTNILHIYNYDPDYGTEYYEPEDDYGAKIPGYKTIQPRTSELLLPSAERSAQKG